MTCVGLATQTSSAQPAAGLRTDRLTPALYELTGTEDGNVLVYVGRSGITLVDAGEATSAHTIQDAVRAISAMPVRLVIVTHYHSDHIGGAGLWHRQGATIVAHEHVAAQAVKDTLIPELDWHRTPAEPDALPTRTFRDTVEFTDGDERISVIHVDSAHTDGDAIVWFHHADVIHMGDILSTPPGIDVPVGGSLDGLVAGVTRALTMAGPRTRIVPGHGAVTDRAFLQRYQAMLVRLRDAVDGAVSNGWSLQRLLDTHPASGDGAMLGGERIGPQLLALAYQARVRRSSN